MSRNRVELLNTKEYTSIESVFKTHYTSLYAYGMKICGNSLLVKDSIQDVFVGLCNSGMQTSHIQSTRSYLFISLRRRILEIRTSHERREVRNLHFVRALSDSGKSPEELFLAREIDEEQHSMINDVIASLTDRQREAVHLRFYENMAYEEIAQIMNVREQSVRNQIFRVLKSLRKRFSSKKKPLVL